MSRVYQKGEQEQTYSDNSGVVGHNRRLVLLYRCWGLLDPQVFDICAAEDDVLIELVRGSNLLARLAVLGFAALGSKGADILEGDGGIVRVDLVQCAYIAMRFVSGGELEGGGRQPRA